ncbi:forkhead domain-containing protein [Dendryphion nanum]|uniref:Forkhead domain-containing protein n=1 Tax=Dendryphion nanum TaxID=256645 RepID=A0A9P9DKW1_9PLEO|nr:forkhead domain-containing protein [Dendryphion nanum]
MASTYTRSNSPRDSQFSVNSMGYDDASAYQWPSPYELPMSHLGQDGTGVMASYPTSSQYHSETHSGLEYIPNGLPYSNNYNITYSPFALESSCPRSYLGGLGLTQPVGDMAIAESYESYPPAAYVLEPPKQHEGTDTTDQTTSSQLMQLNTDFDNHCSNIKAEGPMGYDSPYGSTPCSTPAPGSSSQLHNQKSDYMAGVDENGIDKEQPYAQLIYRALLEAPEHTMVLRDIYDWFKENTDKAADKETKGWQNSIRHNLSMNGAFEKVDHPSEDSKKGFLWRLTQDAIRDGVKSTTRYRSKHPNKRGHRSQHPLPQRQASGAKGGQAAKRSAKMKKSQRMHDRYPHRSEHFMSRPMPTSYPGYDSHHTCADISIPYSPSPYYSSDLEFDTPTTHSTYGSPVLEQSVDFGLYSSSSLPPAMYGADMGLVPDQKASVPLFYNTDRSSSPSGSDPEPRTPESTGDIDMDTGYSAENTQIWDDVSSNYPE